jgi:UDP-glucose 4-epimerase
MLTGQRVLVTGGTGSLGSVLVRRLLSGELGRPESVTVFSRDEAKQHDMRLAYEHRSESTDEVIFQDWRNVLRFSLGDVADDRSIGSVLQEADVVFNAAAMKQVPSCEYFPAQAVRTNILGPENIVRSIRQHRLPVKTVVGISTDKACKPVNVMGMTKAIQERVFIQANMDCGDTRLVAARYGNVLASRGSVIPLFLEQIKLGGPLTITTPDMTRFLMNLDRAVDTIFAALRGALPGEIYIPRVPAARIVDVAMAMIRDRPIELAFTGIRPGEKIDEVLVSEEEASRTVVRGDYFVIRPMLPELAQDPPGDRPMELAEYSSGQDLLDQPGVLRLLAENSLLPEDAAVLQPR